MTPEPGETRARTVLLFVAIPLEASPLVARLGGVRERLPDAVAAWRGRFPGGTAWIVQTGIGTARAERAAEAALARLGADAVVSTGCAAALVADLAPGDVVVATETAARGASAASDPGWAGVYERAAGAAGLRVRRGPVWTADALVPGADARRALAAEHGALAVEMEGIAVGAAARRASVPFVAVRTVLDGLDLEVPDGLVDERGRVRPLRVAAALARSPRLVRTLAALRHAAARSADSLGRVHAEALRAVSEDRA